MPKSIGIEEVPHSPNTSDEARKIYNPTDEDFLFYWNRVREPKPYTIPANGFAIFPEYKAYHGAKQLAEKIVYGKWLEGSIKRINDLIAKGATNALDPESGKPLPPKEIQRVMEVILAGKEVESLETIIEPPISTENLTEKEAKEKIVDEDFEVKEKKVDGAPNYEKMSWNKLRALSKERGVYKAGMNKTTVIEVLNKSSQV